MFDLNAQRPNVASHGATARSAGLRAAGAGRNTDTNGVNAPRRNVTGHAEAPVGVSIFSSYANGIGAVASLQETIAVEIVDRNTYRPWSQDHSDTDHYIHHLLRSSSTSAHVEWEYEPNMVISSRVPAGRGLKTSSALGVAATAASFQALGTTGEFQQIAESASLAAARARVTQAGSIDDVFASIHGGIVIADCRRNRLIDRWLAPNDYDLLLYISNERIPVAHLLDRRLALRPYASCFDDFVHELINASDRESSLFGVMTKAALITARALAYPTAPLQAALTAGAIAVTLSGKGPAIGAVVEPSYVDAVVDSWAEYPGTIIRTKFSNAGLRMGNKKPSMDTPSSRR